jgi:hypothetical protein
MPMVRMPCPSQPILMLRAAGALVPAARTRHS